MVTQAECSGTDDQGGRHWKHMLMKYGKRSVNHKSVFTLDHIYKHLVWIF